MQGAVIRRAHGLAALWLGCCSLMLGGCAIFQQPGSSGPPARQGSPNVDRYEQRRQDLLRVREWSLQARVATGGLIGWTGNLRWKQAGETFDLVIGGPLGGGLRAQGVPDRVLVTTSEGSFETHDPESFFERELGWRFPLTRLRFWSLGVPDPRLPSSRLFVDEIGLARDFTQDGWRIQYADYVDVHGRYLPASFSLSNGEKTVRVVIDNWLRIG